jgi:hypothetical protein
MLISKIFFGIPISMIIIVPTVVLANESIVCRFQEQTHRGTILQCIRSQSLSIYALSVLKAAFSLSDNARHISPNFLPIPPKVISGFSSLTLARFSFENNMKPVKAFLPPAEPLAAAFCETFQGESKIY